MIKFELKKMHLVFKLDMNISEYYHVYFETVSDLHLALYYVDFHLC